MMMLCVVPIKEGAAESSGVLDRAEPSGKLWSVLKRFELGLGKSIVIGYVWPAVGLGYTQVAEQHGEAFGLH